MEGNFSTSLQCNDNQYDLLLPDIQSLIHIVYGWVVCACDFSNLCEHGQSSLHHITRERKHLMDYKDRYLPLQCSK